MFLPCSLRALCPSSPPCRVAVATIAAPRYPARGARRGNPPARPASGSAEPSHDLRPCLTSAAPAAPVRPPGGSQVCFSLARPLFFPCSLRALCPSSPPCRVAVATIAAPRYPARGLVRAIPPPAPRPLAAPVRPQGGSPFRAYSQYG